MAFLTTLLVDNGFGLGEHVLPLTGAFNDFEIVQSFALSSLVLGKVSWAGTSAVADSNIDSFAFVGVCIFEKGNTQKHMRWNVLGEPRLKLIDESCPVSVFSSENLDTRNSCGVDTTGIPQELVVGSTDVLWSLDKTHDIFACHLSLCIWTGEVFPFSLL